MAYNFGYNTNPYYSGYNPQIQQAQNQYLVSQLGCKAPVPAFNVPAPWQYGNYGCSDCSNY